MKIIVEKGFKGDAPGHVRYITLELNDGSRLQIEDHMEARNGIRILGDSGNAKTRSNGICVQPVSGSVVDVMTCPLGRPTTYLEKED